jgi:ABC-type iron transport system FetAB ATPase subunit
MNQGVKVQLDQREIRNVKMERTLFVILLNLYEYSQYITKETLERYGNIKTRAQVIRSVKYADDLVLLAKEETVLQSVNDRLTEIARCYGIEMGV